MDSEKQYMRRCVEFSGYMSLVYSVQLTEHTSVRRTAESVSKYNCFRLKSCDSDGKPVCGYDETDAAIAKFENDCALFKVNCDGKGRNLFAIVDDNICETKVIPETTTSTRLTSPTIDYYYDLVDHTPPDTSTHFWQDAHMLGRHITGRHYGEARLRDDPIQNYFPSNLMTLVMRH